MPNLKMYRMCLAKSPRVKTAIRGMCDHPSLCAQSLFTLLNKIGVIYGYLGEMVKKPLQKKVQMVEIERVSAYFQ